MFSRPWRAEHLQTLPLHKASGDGAFGEGHPEPLLARIAADALPPLPTLHRGLVQPVGQEGVGLDALSAEPHQLQVGVGQAAPIKVALHVRFFTASHREVPGATTTEQRNF